MFNPENMFNQPENKQDLPEENKAEKVSPESIEIAENSLRDFLKLKPEENVLLLMDKKTNAETSQILEKAVGEIGSRLNNLFLDKQVTRKQIKELLKDNQVVIDVSAESCKATEDIYDDIEETGSRLLALYDLSPEAFSKEGALAEPLKDIEYRLGKMESILEEAVGFRITSRYGTDLELALRPFKERRWAKDTGVIDQPGQWDNLPGGEIYTTPDERKVNGVLVLPVLESMTVPGQGVDEFVRLTIKDGVITSIQGGESAEKLRKKFNEVAKDDAEEGKNPLTVYRIAEIGFGANSKARTTVLDPSKPYDYPGVSIVETEKRYGTMHLAFGDAQHGEEGVDGFEEAGIHCDFVLPRNGLTVEMFTHEDDFKKKTNGRKVISEGNLSFF